jgi:hypothetical protein
MTSTDAPSSHRQMAPTQLATRVAAIAAALLAVSLFWTVAAIDVPHDASDQELLTWWQDSANRVSGVISGMSAILVAITIPVVTNHLQRLDAATHAPQWLGFARSMAGAVTAVWLVTGAARATVGHLVDTMNEPLPDVGVLRFATGFNYSLLGLAGLGVLALCMFAVSIVVVRTGVFGRWLAYVGLTFSTLMLVAVVAQYGAYTTPLAIVWSLCLAVAIWREPAVISD